MRSFGELMGHITSSQFSICAVLKGVPNPNQGINNEDYKSKAQAVKTLAASFAFCDDAFSSLTEKSLLEYVKERDGEITRAGSIAHFFAHGNDVYGYAAVYMRLKGLVPPTTERGMVGRFGPGAAKPASPKGSEGSGRVRRYARQPPRKAGTASPGSAKARQLSAERTVVPPSRPTHSDNRGNWPTRLLSSASYAQAE